MADVFVSYSSKDKSAVQPLVRVIETAGWSVFWDSMTLPGEQWDILIEKQLTDAKCVVVVWSAESVQSRWVLAEAHRALKPTSRLVPVTFDDTKAPFGFELIQIQQLLSWDQKTHTPEIDRLLEGIKKVISSHPVPFSELDQATIAPNDGETAVAPGDGLSTVEPGEHRDPVPEEPHLGDDAPKPPPVEGVAETNPDQFVLLPPKTGNGETIAIKEDPLPIGEPPAEGLSLTTRRWLVGSIGGFALVGGLGAIFLSRQGAVPGEPRLPPTSIPPTLPPPNPGPATETGTGLKGRLSLDLSQAVVLRSVAFSSARPELAIAGDDGCVRLLDWSKFQVLARFPERTGGRPIKQISYSRDGLRLALCRVDGRFEVWELGGGMPRKSIDASTESEKLFSIANYPDARAQRYVATGGANGTEIWDIRRDPPRLVGNPNIHKGTVRAISYTTLSSGVFVSGGEDGQIVFHMPGNKQKNISAHTKGVFSVSISSDNRHVVSGGNEGLIKIWDLNSQTLIRTLHGHTKYVLAVAFSNDGRSVVSGGGDSTVRVWDSASGNIKFVLKGHERDVESVAISPSGNRIVSTSEDKTLRVWDVNTRRQLLSFAVFRDGECAAITEEGEYHGTDGVYKHLMLDVDGNRKRIPPEYRKMHEKREGLSHILAN